MDLKKVSTEMLKRIEELEKAAYTFDELIKPRAEADKAILKRMREQYLKLDALMQKMSEAPDTVTDDDIRECVPSQFR